MTTMQIAFWIGITAIFALPAIIALIVSLFHQGLANMISGSYGWILGRLFIDNNARATGFFILAILFTISALIGGRGEPLLSNEIATVSKKVSAIKMPDTFKDFLWRAATNDGEITVKKKAPEPEVKEVKKVTAPEKPAKSEIFWVSWWHWILAITVWVIALLYLPASRRDEFFKIFKDWWNGPNTIKAEVTVAGDDQSGGGSVIAGAGNALAAAGRAAGGYTPLKDLAMNMLNSIIMEKIFGKKRTS
jgi:hypothetical protein